VREAATSTEARSVIDHLDIGENGKPRPGSLGNVRAILAYSPEYAGRLWWSDRLLTAHLDDEQLSDEHVVQMQIDMEALYGVLERSKGTVKDMAINLARTNRRNEVKEMFEAEEWDGTDRASTWLTTVLGVEDTELHRAYARKFLISVCARVYDPGCKVDQVLLLSGAQGMKKSSVFEILAGRRWFSDSRMDLSNKDSYMQLFQALIYEWSENHKAGSGAVEEEKAFISSRRDSFRPPYESAVRSFDRHTIIVATTNLPYPLTDPTGNRRWWPVSVTKVADSEWLKANRGQLWAEALVAYKAGELHYFDENSELAEMRRAESEAYVRDDPRMDKIRQWARTDSAPRHRGVTVAEVTERVLEIHASDLHKHATVVGQLLRDCGFVRLARRIQKDGSRSVRWLSPHTQLPEGETFESDAEQARHAAQYSPLETSTRRGVVLPLNRQG
jgi:putative DNA primase/helicase